MIERVLQFVVNLDGATVGVWIFVVVTAGMLGWSFFHSWLEDHDRKVWDDAYHSGILAGRRQERRETGDDTIREPGMETVVAFYNSMGDPRLGEEGPAIKMEVLRSASLRMTGLEEGKR